MKKFIEIPAQLKIKVMRKDIKRAVCEDPFRCPIARAMKRMYGDHPFAAYTRLQIALAGTIRTNYIVPRAASKFMRAFDRGDKVKPFSFVANKRRQHAN